jgi:hypothetical protein
LILVSREGAGRSQPMYGGLAVRITHKAGGGDGYARVSSFQPDPEGLDIWRECTISSEAGQEYVAMETREALSKSTELASYLRVEVKTVRKSENPEVKEIEHENE